MREMQSQRQTLEKDGEILVSKIKDLQEAKKEGDEKLAHTKESLNKLEAEENKFKSDRIEIDQTIVKYDESITEAGKNVKHWKREINKLKLEDIPGREVLELRDFFASEEGKQELAELNAEAWQYEALKME